MVPPSPCSTGRQKPFRNTRGKLELRYGGGKTCARIGAQFIGRWRDVIGYRHCDRGFPFLWSDSSQPPARWHSLGEGPANYFADTPVGAWAEFIRHEGITEEADLASVDRSLWAVEIPEAAYPKPNLPRSTLLGGLLTYTDCQDEARRLRQGGAQCLEAPSAALLPRGARGWVAMPNIQAAHGSRSGKVWVWFGARPDFAAWPAVEGGTPPSRVLPLVRHLTF